MLQSYTYGVRSNIPSSRVGLKTDCIPDIRCIPDMAYNNYTTIRKMAPKAGARKSAAKRAPARSRIPRAISNYSTKLL